MPAHLHLKDGEPHLLERGAILYIAPRVYFRSVYMEGICVLSCLRVHLLEHDDVHKCSYIINFSHLYPVSKFLRPQDF